MIPFQFAKARVLGKGTRMTDVSRLQGIGVGTRRSMALCTMVLMVGFSLVASESYSQYSSRSEQNIKVAYLYNFMRYVRWPDGAFEDNTSPIVIGVLANDPLNRLLHQVAGQKQARGRSIVIKEFSTVSKITGCHLVFLHAGVSSNEIAEAIRGTESAGVLLICDTATNNLPGAPIRFFADQDGTIGLQINIDAMARRGLQADAKLLNIATVVRD